MPDLWIVNASPIIVLAKVGQLRLLEELSEECVVPEAVAVEILAGPSEDPARQALEEGWGRRQAPNDVFIELVEWGLGPGETSVLALAKERTPAVAILDDGAARSCAKTFNIPVMGTLAIVLRAKKAGLIPAASEVFRDMRAAGFHLNDRIVQQVLGGIGETW